VTFALIDGTFGFLGAKDGGKSYTNAYEVMLPFVAMARRLSIGCVAVRHVRKSEGSALAKGIGSVGFGALARSTVSVSVEQQDEDRRLFSHAGVNTAEIGATLAFRVDGVMLPGFERSVGRVAWLGPVEVTANEAVATNSQEDKAEQDLAADFLHEFIDAPKESAEVREAAKKAGIAMRTVQRTAKRLGIRFHRPGFGKPVVWFPPDSTDDSMRAKNPHLRHAYLSGATGANGREWAAQSSDTTASSPRTNGPGSP
jgi:hypothetical protein